MITANLGLALARLEHSTVVVDADLGGSDLHNILGLDNLGPGMGELLTQRGLNLANLIRPIREPRFYFVPGDACLPAATNPRFQKKRKLFYDMNNLPHSFVLLDLGAGSSITITDFFLSSPFSLLVMTPERAAELNAFNFLKNLVYRLLAPLARNNTGFARALAAFQDRGQGPGSGALHKLVDSLAAEQQARVKEILEQPRPKLVINRIHKIDEFIQARQVQSWAFNDLGLALEVMAFLPEDANVAQAARQGVPALDLDPRSPFCRAMAMLALKIALWAGKRELWQQQQASIQDSFTRSATEFAAFFPTPGR